MIGTVILIDKNEADKLLATWNYKEFLDFCSMTDEEVNEVIDSWRSDHLWTKDNGVWKLRHAVWMDE